MKHTFKCAGEVTHYVVGDFVTPSGQLIPDGTAVHLRGSRFEGDKWLCMVDSPVKIKAANMYTFVIPHSRLRRA